MEKLKNFKIEAFVENIENYFENILRHIVLKR